jgi:hypothetical protein
MPEFPVVDEVEALPEEPPPAPHDVIKTAHTRIAKNLMLLPQGHVEYG